MYTLEFYHKKLKELEFEFPNLPVDVINDLEVKESSAQKKMYITGEVWMGINKQDYREIFELYSHSVISSGKTVSTGLGMMIRESWLIKNKIDLTVIEKNKDVISYHLKHNPSLMEKITVLEMDAIDYNQPCDTLLLDHFEREPYDYIIQQVIDISEKIDCKTVWFWPIERIILQDSMKNKRSLMESYDLLKNKIKKLPTLTENNIIEFVDLWCLHRQPL